MTNPAPRAGARTVRVLIVDDSPFMRRALGRLLAAGPGITVVGEAQDGLEAVRKALELRPDVITMDVEMPRMDGVSAVGEIMNSVATPIVMVSTLTAEGASTAIRALEAGAVECVGKPSGLSADLVDVGERLVAAVGRASQAHVRRRPAAPSRPSPVAPPAANRAQPRGPTGMPARNLLVIGSSTGGPPALTHVVPALPAGLPAAVVIVQHMPAGFTGALARRLDSMSALAVSEAVDGELLLQGHAYIAPGDFHLRIGPDRRIHLDQAPSLHGVRPAVDITLASVAEVFGRAASVAILTGMGKDGAEGAAKIEEAGGRVFVQDEATSVVYGMPRVALERTKHATQLPVEKIGAALAATVTTTRGER